MLSIGVVVPFLSAFLSHDGFSFSPLKEILLSLGLSYSDNLVLPLTIFFIATIILSGFSRLSVAWLSTNLSYKIGSDLSLNIYRRALYQPYEDHIKNNSTFIMDAMFTKVNLVTETVILGGLNFIISFIMIVSILCILVFINFYLTTITFLFFGTFYFITIKLVRSKSVENSKKIAEGSSSVLRIIQEGLGGIRDILIGSHQEGYCETYHKVNYKMRRTQGINYFLSISPKYIMESIGLVFLASLVFLFSNNGNGLLQAIPLIGMITMGSQRLLPSLQQLYTSWVGILASQQSLLDILNLLNQPVNFSYKNKKSILLGFNKSIKLRNVSFRYNTEQKFILDNVNLTIYKGDRIGIVGRSGSGKSTLVDIIMCLLTPSKGSMFIDDRACKAPFHASWQKNISHVPQSVFLSDSSIANNIAFGSKHEEIDVLRIKQAIELASLNDLIDSLPEGYDTIVGERGVRLSGGQCQRIGIARALYSRKNIIILDEATSALDNKTQIEIINNISRLEKKITLIFISHRATALSCCNKILKVENGNVRRLK